MELYASSISKDDVVTVVVVVVISVTVFFKA